MTLKPIECVKIVEYLQKTNPGIITEAETQIKKPEAELSYFYLLLKVLNYYCERKGFTQDHITGTGISRQGVYDRTIFVAICLKLYCPEVFKEDVTYDIRNNLREEIAGMLEIKTPNWISQQVDGIVLNMRIYDTFRDQVNDYVEYIKEKLQTKEVKQELQNQLYQ